MPEAPQDGFAVSPEAPHGALRLRPEGAPAASPLAMRDLVAAGFYHHRALLAGLLLPLALAAGASTLVHTRYEAEARLLVLIGRDYVGEGGSAAAAANLVPDQARAVQTEVELLSSPATMAAALQALPGGRQRLAPAGAGLGAQDAVVAQALRQLRIGVAPNSNVLRVQYTDPDPVLAADLVNVLVQAYLAQRRQVFARSQSDFLAEQRDQAAARLQALVGQTEATRRAHRVIDAAREREALLGRRHELAVARQAAETRGRVLALEIAAHGRHLAGLPAELVIQREATRQPLNEYRRGLLGRIEAERRAATGPAAEELDRRAGALRAALDRDSELAGEQRRSGPNPRYEQLALERARRMAEAEGLRATLEGIGQEQAAVEARLGELEAIEAQLGQLARQTQLEEQTYLEYARRTEDARVQEDAARRREANVRQIQAAEPPSRGRNLALSILLGGLAAGLMLAPLLALLRARTRRVFLLPGEVEQALRLPMLGSFWAEARGKARRHAGEFGRANLATASRLAHHLLARGLLGKPGGAALHIAAGREAAEAATQVAGLAALALANLCPDRVLLVSRTAPGAAEPVAGEDAATLPGLRRITGTRLHVLPPEAVDALVQRLGPGPALATLRGGFGIVVIDGGGFDEELPSLALAAAADEALLVVQAERSGRQAGRALVRKLEDLGCPVLGSVLAGRRRLIPDFLYNLL